MNAGINRSTRQQVSQAVKAVESKKGEDVAILEMDRASGAFTDYFIVCSGTNSRQIQAIADEVERQLSAAGSRPNSVEGYTQAEWVLLDYVDFVVHIFSQRARQFYDLERLWKSARRLKLSDLARKAAPVLKKVARKRVATRSGGSSRKKASKTPRTRTVKASKRSGKKRT